MVHDAAMSAAPTKVSPALENLIQRIPKVELHLHIEGTLEPELAFALAKRNGVQLPFDTVESLRAAYNFSDLQSFLNLYYASADVLRTRADFYALAMSYFTRAYADGVVHAELFFDPQTHTSRGVAMGTVIGGLRDAMTDAESRYGMTSELILCFLRHLSQAEALETLHDAMPFRREFIGVGLDSGERGNPPSKFAEVFAKARSLGLRLVAHAGEEGPADYIHQALDILRVERIDHGVRCDEDPKLVARLARERIALTVCPLSNLKLRVVKDLKQHNFAKLLRAGVAVTINSDDPAYFGGYIADNYRATVAALNLSQAEIVEVTQNAIRASFLPATQKATLLAKVRAIAASNR
jgi:adenine deaminase